MMKYIDRIVPFASVFCSAAVVTLLLTPVVREVNRRLGMVDRPDPRRINKLPVPRGGGVAVFLGLFLTFWLNALFFDLGFPIAGTEHPVRMTALASLIFLIGLADDKFSLRPLLKLAGQLLTAFLAWSWAGLGFSDLWPSIPAGVECFLTVFWITGAVNAFNLIDGLDGLASGLAFIASVGMAVTLVLTGSPESTLFHFAFAGSMFGFLRYNYNPASVFLGDSGSMLIGFVIATLPLAHQVPNSFLVSIGVPLLAMGVPIFDTALAILRRTIRRLIRRREGSREPDAGQSDKVMTPDHDHLHHRILRSTGLNQRKAAWILYLMALVAVGFGITGVLLASRSAAVWMVALSLAAVVVFRDMAKIEIFDTGRLLSSIAHDRDFSARRRLSRISVPLLVVSDLLMLLIAVTVTLWALQIPASRNMFRIAMPVRILPTFIALTLFRAYSTVWSRAMFSNYFRLMLACAAGAVAGGAGVLLAPGLSAKHGVPATLLYFSLSFILVSVIRVLRPAFRDLFYAIDCSRLKARRDVSRILVYGAGLRYRAFRRELVRKASENSRIIVGIIDDDQFLQGRHIGGIRVAGNLDRAPEIVDELNVDSVVIACELDEERLRRAKEVFSACGVKVTNFIFCEKEV